MRYKEVASLVKLAKRSISVTFHRDRASRELRFTCHHSQGKKMINSSEKTMISAEDQTASLEERVVRLERRNRMLMIFCVCVPILSIALGADAPKTIENDKTVVANKFVLTNAQGKMRGSLSLNRGNARLTLYDVHGNERILIGDNGRDGDPHVRLLSSDGISQVVAEIDKNSQTGAISVYRANGQRQDAIGRD